MKKDSNESIAIFCKTRNWTCLSDYVGSKTSLEWKCNVCEHVWSSKYGVARKRQHCPRCEIKQEIVNFCETKNWTCMTNYIGRLDKTSIQWQCNVCKFSWSSKYSNAQLRKGCPRCTKGIYKYSLEEAIKVGEKRGFRLLETEYKRSDIPMKWQCIDCDYTWFTSLANVNREYRGKGCPNCNGIPDYTIETVIKIAEERNITCLDDSYRDCNTPMNWRCNKCQREWKTTFRSLKQNIGCIKCTFKEKMCLSIDDVKETIKDRDIECLDTEYTNIKIHMNWKCLKCHKSWKACFDHIRNIGTGCPNCSAYRSQKTCRKYFEEFMGLEFPTLRPKFLQGLEYDGYNEALKLAFEYQGLQHYERIHFFHKKEGDFEKLQENDLRKEKLSKQAGITLIKIPHTFSYVNESELAKYILEKLIETDFIVLYYPEK